MSLIKWHKDDSLFPGFSSFFDDFLGKDYLKTISTGTSVPAVNVKEEDNLFRVELAAPGLKKEDFEIDLEHNVLTISCQKEDKQEEEKDGKYTRREYCFHSFSRSFTLPDNINIEKIEANYQDGILKIDIPKKAPSAEVKKQIEIK